MPGLQKNCFGLSGHSLSENKGGGEGQAPPLNLPLAAILHIKSPQTPRISNFPASLSFQATGFYLGYLRGGSFPPKMPSFPPPKKMLLSLQCMSNYIRKIIQTRRGQCTHWNISQKCVLKCTRLHLRAYSFKKFIGGGGMPPDPPRKLVAFSHLGLLT